MSTNNSFSNWLLIPVILFSIFTLLLPVMPTKTACAQVFSDVNVGNYHYVAINHLYNEGIINGYEDGTFKPDQIVNRAEALKMLTLASGLFEEDLESDENSNSENDTEPPFSDTPVNAWYTPYLIPAKEKGIICGYNDNSFKPEQTINLAEALKIYLESYDNIVYPHLEDFLYDDTPLDAWFTKYTAYAKSRDMLTINLDNLARPEQSMTRGNLAEIIYRHKMFGQGFHFGKATFYGAAVQGHNTASGETFDMNSFTAAHKTLPFGTVVRVTNLASGEYVDVRITDRGPYGAGRVLDLSSGAFKELASLSRGIINVQYEVISTP